MLDFDASKSQLANSKDKKPKTETILKKRKRDEGDTAGLGQEDEASKRQKLEHKSETFKSLFIKESKNTEGKYEGDFMTRCAKWGLQ